MGGRCQSIHNSHMYSPSYSIFPWFSFFLETQKSTEKQSSKDKHLIQSDHNKCFCEELLRLCQCDLCRRFDLLFHNNVTTEKMVRSIFLRDDNKSDSTICQTCTCTKNKSKPNLRNKDEFQKYSKSLSDLFASVAVKSKDEIKADDVGNARLIPFPLEFNPLYTSPWNNLRQFNRSSRYLFYSNLENFYRALYTKARKNALMSA